MGNVYRKQGIAGGPPSPLPPVLDPNTNCMARAEVMDRCCNRTVSGPALVGGRCCYEFCNAGCCGRPVVAFGEPVTARTMVRPDWQIVPPTADRTTGVSELTRAALHTAYMRDALLEHASAASFTVFVLELLALGAPPELIAMAQSAAEDEIEHARLMFGIANAFGSGENEYGPGVFSLRGIAPSDDLAVVATVCVRDGCIGETVASIVAAQQAERARNAHIREPLTKIAGDEARHAELAWRFVRWALRIGDGIVRTSVARAFQSGLPAGNLVPPGVDQQAWQAAGRLLQSEHQALAQQTMQRIIEPCALALLRQTPAGTRSDR